MSYEHRPDFEKIKIAARPDIDQSNEPVCMSAPCICGSEIHSWSAVLYPSKWMIQGNDVRDLRMVVFVKPSEM
jgi:hypothetical protein